MCIICSDHVEIDGRSEALLSLASWYALVFVVNQITKSVWYVLVVDMLWIGDGNLRVIDKKTEISAIAKRDRGLRNREHWHS